MKLGILFLLALATNVYAAFPIINFQGLSGEYVDNKGVAFAEFGKYDLDVVKISHKEIQVKFNKKQKHLVLSDNNTSVELKFDFSFLNIFRAITFSGVDIESNKKKFNVFLDQLNIYIDPSEYKISDIEISTDITQVADIGDDVDVLDGFLINGDLNIGSIELGKIDQDSMIKDLKEENPNNKSEIEQRFSTQSRIPIAARNVRVVVRKKTFSGSVKLDSWINLNAYFGGNLNHDPKNNTLTISLLKAKLGYISIRRWVLNSIRKLDLENISVNGSNVVIDLEKTILSSGNRN